MRETWVWSLDWEDSLEKGMYTYVCVCMCVCVCASVFSHSVMSDSLQPFWTVACQAPLSVGFSSKNTRTGCHPPPGDLPNLGIELTSPVSPGLQEILHLLSH